MARTSMSSEKNPRLQIVDAVRGFALSSLFLVHMLEGYELYWENPAPDWASKLVFMLFMGKSFPLMSIGFGFSCYMLIDRPGADASHNALWFVWRLVVLEIIGCMHAMIYSGDIIEILATLGIPLVLATKVRGKGILLGIAMLCLLQPLQWWDLAVTGRGVASAAVLAGGSARTAAYLHGGLLDVVRANMWAGQIAKWHFMVVSGRIFQIFGLYVVGLVLGRARFFARLEELRRGRTLALIASVAAAASLHFFHPALVAGMGRSGGAEAGAIFGTILEGWEDLAVTACWGLMICALWQGPVRLLLAPLASVGRATLTLYILQSLLFVPLLYPFGGNLYAAWDGPTRLMVGMVAVGAQVCCANLWFRRYRYGPVEWAWRAATDMRWDIPFLRAPARPVHRSESGLQAGTVQT